VKPILRNSSDNQRKIYGAWLSGEDYENSLNEKLKHCRQDVGSGQER